jgi:plastocyanin
MRHSPLTLPIAFAAAVVAFIATGVAVAQGGEAMVTIGDALEPATVVVASGDAVTWINTDDTPHTIVGVDHSFQSSPIDTNHRYSHRFVKPGAYAYYSEYPHLSGTVIVRQP